jgi:hypothetical protein
MTVKVVSTDEERSVLRERKPLGHQLRISIDIVDGGYILNYPSLDFNYPTEVYTTEVFSSGPKLKKKINQILENFKPSQ